MCAVIVNVDAVRIREWLAWQSICYLDNALHATGAISTSSSDAPHSWLMAQGPSILHRISYGWISEHEAKLLESAVGETDFTGHSDDFYMEDLYPDGNTPASNMDRRTAAILQAYEKASALCLAWEAKAQEKTEYMKDGFGIRMQRSFSCSGIDDMIERLGSEWGLPSCVEALRSGVPISDLVA